MAKGKYISDFELDVIRIAYSKGINCAKIARFLKRNKQTVYNKAHEMKEDGTMDRLPMCFVVDEIAEAVEKS